MAPTWAGPSLFPRNYGCPFKNFYCIPVVSKWVPVVLELQNCLKCLQKCVYTFRNLEMDFSLISSSPDELFTYKIKKVLLLTNLYAYCEFHEIFVIFFKISLICQNTENLFFFLLVWGHFEAVF